LVGELCSRWLQNLLAYVRDQLQQLPQFTYQMLCGLTGTGKTYVLHQLGQRGAQVLIWKVWQTIVVLYSVKNGRLLNQSKIL